MSVDPGWERQVAENARRHRELHERVSELSITETSRTGAVEVTVAASGVLTDLEISEDWLPKSMHEVSSEIMDCLRRAQARIPDLLRDTVFSVVGTRDADAHLVVADARARFPEVEPDDPEQPDDGRLRPGGDEDWDGAPVMEDV